MRGLGVGRRRSGDLDVDGHAGPHYAGMLDPAGHAAQAHRGLRELRWRGAMNGADHRPGDRAGEVLAADLTEKHGLVVEGYEKEKAALEEAKSRLEGARRSLEIALSAKEKDEAQLKASLKESGEIVEQLSGKIAG